MSGRQELQPKDWFLPGIFVLMVMLLIAVLIWRNQGEYLERHREVVDILAKQAAMTITSDLENSVEFLQLLARAMAERRLTEASFQEIASDYVQKHPALINITWADSDYFIRWTAPYAPNKLVVGLKLDLPEPQRASLAAQQSGQPEYTRPFTVIQGISAFEVYVPVFSGERFLGTFGGVFSAKGLLLHTTPIPKSVLGQVHLALVSAAGAVLAERPERSALPGSCVVLVPLDPPGFDVKLRVSDYHIYFFLEWLLVALAGVGFGVALLISLRKLNRQMTRCQQAEQLAAQGEAHLRSLYQAVQAGILLQDLNGKILQVNRPACDMLKVPQKELIGKSFIDPCWQMVDESGNPVTEAEHPAMLTIRTRQPQEEVIRGLFGDPFKRIWLSISTQPIVDPSTGSLTEVLITFHDISDARARQENLEYLSVHDPLTGLLNRRFVEEEVIKEIARAGRYQAYLSFLMLDIDHFKQINDRYGHNIGDQALCLLAQQVSKHIRDSDYLARYGGEEFILILPGTAAGQAWSLAEKLRQQVEAASFAKVDGEPLRMTISIGVATFPEHGEDWETLFKAVDGALYQAKQKGRNQVVVADNKYSPNSGR